VAGLDPPAAGAAAADLDLQAGHQRPGGRQLLHVLGRHPLQRHLPAAARAARRQPHRNDLVDLLGRAPVGAGAGGAARLTPRAAWDGHRVARGARRRLALGRPAPRLHLAAPPLVDLLEPFALGRQALVLHAQPFAFGLQPFALGLQPPLLLAQRGVLLPTPGDPPAPPGRASQTPTDLRTCRLRGHAARRLQPTHPGSRTRPLTTAGRGQDPGPPDPTTTMAPAVRVPCGQGVQHRVEHACG
jgi:hypothetical protein